jgi:hypothetical protein
MGVSGCHRGPERVMHATGKVTPPAPLFAPAIPSVPQEPLPLAHWTREERTAHLLGMMRKRVWGRRASLPDIRRVVTDLGPLVREAAQQRAVLPYLQQIAQDHHQTLDEARETWVALQEADLLLEAGGDPDDISPAGAVGVAQWMPSTAAEHGLKVNLIESRRLTARINDLNRRIAWLTYLPRKDADPNASGKPAFTPADFTRLDAVKTERDTLRLQRQHIDNRYEPRTALFAHTRYLLSLYPKFPSLDWVFQAYHGGEGGVKKALRLYLGGKLPSAAQAIRTGNQGGRLSYEDVYFTVSTHAHIPEFLYLYGRGDDHRHYWWKLKSSQQALAAYRRDPNAFEKEWAELLPGRRTEAVWYPDAPAHAVADLNALRAAQGRGLVPVLSTRNMMVRPAPLDSPNASVYAALQSPAKGALLLAVSAYRRTGGKTPLVVGDMTVTPEYSARLRAAHPPKPSLQPLFPPDPDLKALPGGGPPAEFDYHTTGLAFDLLRPAAPNDWKTLEYALGYLEERQIIAVTEAKDNDERRYHIVPNPRYAVALSKIAQTGQMPNLPDLQSVAL